MATTPKLAALQPAVEREGNRASEAAKAGRSGEGTGVDVRASLPPIYRDQGHQGGRDQGQGGHHTQLARVIQGARTGLFPSIPGRSGLKTLFNAVSPASYHDSSVAAARWVPISATERYRPRWVNKYGPDTGRRIKFDAPAYCAATPHIVRHPGYDIPADWTNQLKYGLTEARLNDTTDGRPMPHRIAVYNLGGAIRA